MAPSASTGAAPQFPDVQPPGARQPAHQARRRPSPAGRPRSRCGTGLGAAPGTRPDRRHVAPRRFTEPDAPAGGPLHPQVVLPRREHPHHPWAVKADHDLAAVFQRIALGVLGLPGHRPVSQRKGRQRVTGRIDPVAVDGQGRRSSDRGQPTYLDREHIICARQQCKAPAISIPASVAPACDGLGDDPMPVTASLGSTVVLPVVHGWRSSAALVPNRG